MWRPSTILACGLGLLVACGSGSSSDAGRPAPEIPALGAAGEVTRDDLQGQHFDSIEEMLRGRVPGLQVITRPNGDLSFRIRGQDSLQPDGREPLLVLDGMAISSRDIGRALRAISPSQIRSVQVLRDVSSTSVYGMRGANGVILIETRRD